MAIIAKLVLGVTLLAIGLAISAFVLSCVNSTGPIKGDGKAILVGFGLAWLGIAFLALP